MAWNARNLGTLGLILSACGCSGSGGGDSTSPPPPPPPSNQAPTVEAGANQVVFEQMIVTLSGTVSDPDSTPSITWSQISGPSATLADASSASTTFLAPSVGADEDLVFRLTADDGANPAVSDEVTVTVRDDGVIVRRISPAGVSYADPEVHPTKPELVYQSAGEIFTIAMDYSTGDIAAGATPRFVDNVSSLTDSKNGPEYALDAGGITITYNNEASDGSLQFFGATENPDGTYTAEQITTNGPDRINQLPSQNASAATSYLVYAREDTPGSAFIAYTDIADPDNEIDLTLVRPGFSGFRWVKGTSLFTTTLADGPNEGQVLLVDAETGVQRVVTNDPGIKFDPFGWYPPEFGGDLAFHAITNGGTITVYRDTGATFFEVAAVLPPPPETTMTFAQSPEPFVSQEGTSYIGLTLKNDPGGIFDTVTESQIWLYGIDDGPERFTLRCDDRRDGLFIRHEAETVSGDSEVLVYFNTVAPNGALELTLCATGLTP